MVSASIFWDGSLPFLSLTFSLFLRPSLISARRYRPCRITGISPTFFPFWFDAIWFLCISCDLNHQYALTLELSSWSSFNPSLRILSFIRFPLVILRRLLRSFLFRFSDFSFLYWLCRGNDFCYSLYWLRFFVALPFSGSILRCSLYPYWASHPLYLWMIYVCYFGLSFGGFSGRAFFQDQTLFNLLRLLLVFFPHFSVFWPWKI